MREQKCLSVLVESTEKAAIRQRAASLDLTTSEYLRRLAQADLMASRILDATAPAACHIPGVSNDVGENSDSNLVLIPPTRQASEASR